MDEDDYKKLPLEERCVHKVWKARVSAYEELSKLFQQIDDDKSPEFSKYLGLVKKFVADSNAMGQEKGLEATLAYAENYAHAGKTASEVMSGIVSKCVSAPKTKTRELAMQLSLMYIEIEKIDTVQEELLKGTEHKNPKIVSGCIQILTTAIKDFGIKIFNPKPIIKRLGPLFADRDKTVRDETRTMVIELYKWMGPNLKAPLQAANLQPVQMTELEAEFGKVETRKMVPSRYIRSQQKKQAALAAKAEDNEDDKEDEENGPESTPDIDPYDLLDPVDILSKLPKDFYEKIEDKKWTERKEALEVVETLLKNPKLESGDYGDLVRALKKVIQKDTNVVCVALAGRCIASLALGLKKRFQTYSGALISPLLEKFKEKKQNVVTAIREAVDATYLSTNLEAILDDALEALHFKNPNVKIEVSLFLARAFTKTSPDAVNKKLLKALTTGLVKNINESDLLVRESSAEAIGTLMKLVGEKAISPFLVEVEKDKLKMDKIKEFFDKAEITVKVSAATKKRPQTAPAKTAPGKEGKSKKATSSSTVSSSTVSTKKTPAIKIVTSGTATVVRSKGNKTSAKTSQKAAVEKELEDFEVDQIIEEILPEQMIKDLFDAAWKTRLAATESLLTKLQEMTSPIQTQALVKTILKKPGLKESNFQVLKVKLDILKYLAENSTFSTTSVNCCVAEITEKFGDAKNGNKVGEVLTLMAEATSLGHVTKYVLEAAFAQKSPKVQQEALSWFSTSMKEFGINGVDIKSLIENCKSALASTNPGVRQTAISTLGVLYLYMGTSLHMFFENEKPALRDQINAEFDKYEGGTAPAPTRGLAAKKSASSNSLDAGEDDSAESQQQENINLEDLISRVDISGQITEALLNEMAEKNWKDRVEALTKLTVIIQEAKFIKSNLGDLPQPLAIRLTDSNVKVAQTALNICQSIAKAMGPSSKQYIRTWFPGFLQNLGDNKSYVRITAMETINAFGEQSGYKEFFEAEMIADALKTGSPILRSELWTWLAEILPKASVKSIPKEELSACIQYLYTNLEDRNADVRKTAGDAVLGLMIHLGYEGMLKRTEKLKQGSQKVIVAQLDKARPNLPVKPLPKKLIEEKTVRGTKPAGNKQNAAARPRSTILFNNKPSASVVSSSSGNARKKDEDVDTSPLLMINNLKHQRTIDETKLKILKWNFTQPREEFVELLKEQMVTANVNRNIIANMFHQDFRYHIKAIELLTEDLAENIDALISNLDLILKWFTLRFFDTNPSVLLKGLEYLSIVFTLLIDKGYRMLENEGSSFIPYLILKIGDPKDSVRNGVRALLTQIERIFPVSRIFTYVMDGIKSKNARQRAECLEVIGLMIADCGVSVCQPTPGSCLKEVAKQISDRDNSVRNAALNCVVQAFNLLGEKVYKLVGNISDKDMSLLEERIKRSKKTVATTVPKVTTEMLPPPPPPTLAPSASIRNGNNVNETMIVMNRDDPDQENDEDEAIGMVPALPSTVASLKTVKKEVKGPFKLEMEELEGVSSYFPKLELIEIDYDFLKEEIKMPSFFDNKVKVMPLSPPKPVIANRYNPNQNIPRSDSDIQKALQLMESQNLSTILQGLKEMLDLMNSPMKISVFPQYEKDLLNAFISILEYLYQMDPINDVQTERAYGNLFKTIDFLFGKLKLGKNASRYCLEKLIFELIRLLTEMKLEKCSEQYVKMINVLCVKIIEEADHTSLLCALIKLLKDVVDGGSDRQVELIMKCIWKVIKLMPTWGENVDYELVVLETHYFLMKYPSKFWSSRAEDTPFRTIKTILHSMVKIKGAKTRLLLLKIPNISDSEIESYIYRLLKGLKIAETQDIPSRQQQQQSSTAATLQRTATLTRGNHYLLTEIFEKIGNKDNSTEGLNLLYDFMEQHPEADIQPFLSKSSKFFQDYIRNGIDTIKQERSCIIKPKNNQDNILANNNFGVGGAEEINPEQTPEYFQERLTRWKHIWNETMAGRPVDHNLWPLQPPTS